MEIYICLLVIAMLVLACFYFALQAKCALEIAAAKTSISDVEYAFMIRRIRENNKTYTLIGIDDLMVRISKEDFEIHEVAVGKIWVYDGTEHYCVDPGQYTLHFR